MPGAGRAAKAGHRTHRAGPKEGLGLINGTQFSTACALVGLFEARGPRRHRLLLPVDRCDHGVDGTAQAGIHALRGHRGQIDVASAMRALMEAV
jgi:histidine ammonia-lyase